MKRASFAFYSILAGIAAAAPAQAQTVIDFNSLSGTLPTYSVSDVTFSTVTAGSLVFGNGPNGTPSLVPQSDSGGSRPEVRADFLTALTGTVSVDLGDFAGDEDLLFLELFDSGSTSLGFTSLAISDSDSSMNTLTLSGANIAFAVFGGRAPSINGSSVFADNFTFTDRNAGAVPEPATWAMMLIGFGAIGASMRRRRPTRNLHQAV